MKVIQLIFKIIIILLGMSPLYMGLSRSRKNGTYFIEEIHQITIQTIVFIICPIISMVCLLDLLGIIKINNLLLDLIN